MLLQLDPQTLLKIVFEMNDQLASAIGLGLTHIQTMDAV
jgi:hypothetical protein